MSRKTLVVQIGMAMAATVALPAIAQGNSFALEEVVVTAQKRAQDMQDIPISVQAFTANAIDKLGADNLSDLSEAAPSLDIGGLGKGSQQWMGMRGVTDFARNVGVTSRMGVYIDGVFQGRSYAADVPLLGLESVELLRGPQGTLFGKNTETGAISLNTKKPTEDFEAQVGLEYGRYNMVKTTAYVNGALTDKLYASASGSYQQADGYFDNLTLNKDDVGDWDTSAVRGQLRFLPTDMFDIRLSGDYTKKHSDQPLATNASLEAYKSYKNFITTDDSENYGTALTADVFLDGDYTLTSISAFRHNEFTTLADDDYTPAELVNVNFNEDSDQYSQELRLKSPVNEKYDWVGGLYYFYNDLSSERTVDLTSTLLGGLLPPTLSPYAPALGGYVEVPNKLTEETWAAYVHGNYRFTDKIELTAGVRYTNEDKDLDWSQQNYPNDPATAQALEDATGVPLSQAPGFFLGAINYDKISRNLNDDDWSPTVGLNYYLQDGVMVYAKYARGYKSGGWNADFMVNGLEYFSYDSESVDSYEVGLKSTLFDDSLRLNMAYYYSEYNDFQVFQQVYNSGGNPSNELTNAAKVVNQGLELESVWIATDHLQFTLNAAYLDTNYDDFINQDGTDYSDNELPFAPEWKVYAGTQFIQPVGSFGDLTFNVDYAYTDSQYTDPSNVSPFELDSYGLWNARVTLTPVDAAWEVSLWGKNLGDKEYQVQSNLNLLSTQRYTWGNPQMYGASFKYFFGS